MNFTCDNCQKRYSIADEKVRGKTVKVRCKNCQNVISVEGPQLPLEESTRVVSLADVERLRAQERSLADPGAGAAAAPAITAPAPVSAPPVAKAPAAALQTPWDDEPTRAAPMRAPVSPWFVMVRNKQEGPLDEGGLREMIATGAVSGRSFFWQQGMADWKRGSDIPELAGLFAPPPAPEPPPPPPPPVAEPPPAPAPARAARAAPARREPEPQPFMPEPEPEPQQQAWAPEPEPEPQHQQQAWAPEPEPPQDDPENTFYQEPAPRSGGRRGQAPAASAAPLNDDQLFSDLDLPGNRDGHDAGAEDDGYGGMPPPEDDDAVAAPVRGKSGERKAVEDPRQGAKKPAVKRRGSAGKLAAIVLLLLLVLLGGAYVLSETLGVMPLRVQTQDAQGNPVERTVFSAEGMSALGDKLTGRSPPAAPKPKAAKPAKAAPTPAPTPPAEPAPTPAAEPPTGGAPTGAGTPAGTETGAVEAAPAGQQQAAADGEKKDAAPEAPKDAQAAAADPDAVGGPSDEEVERVVEKAQAAFRGCAEDELRKNPAFRGGKATLTATVDSSGAVKAVTLSPRKLDRTPVGTCVKDRAKSMVFSSFSGEAVDLEIPVVLTGTL